MARAKIKNLPGGGDPAESFSLSTHPFYLFNHIFLCRGRQLNSDLARYNLDYPRWRVLAVLNECPDCTMQVLADTAGVDRTTLAHTVRLMIDAKLITKTERKTDRRSVVLSLTEKGRKVFRSILPVVIDINQRCFSGFSREETDLFVNQLRRIIKNIRNGSLPVLIEDVAEVAQPSRAVLTSEVSTRSRKRA